MATVSTAMTSTPSSTGASVSTLELSGSPFLNAKASSRTQTTVWIAIPPRRLPVAISTAPVQAALAVMATSGKLVETARNTSPPMASPKPKRAASEFVVLVSLMPANQITTAPARKVPISADNDREPNIANQWIWAAWSPRIFHLEEPEGYFIIEMMRGQRENRLPE